ncbi:ATP-binding protein [Pokkaliibacter sp. CJK22405]|uniref:ATP-binding protein n=1 Tax=Pokkaliibacter sp. CJK22405 TaxID=3384615 RepID=UPI003984EA56
MTEAGRLKRFWRWAIGSLFARNLWLLAVLMLFAQFASLEITREFIQKPMTRELVSLVSRQLTAVKAAMSVLPVEQRDAFVEAYNAESKKTEPRIGGLFNVPILQHLLVHKASRNLKSADMEMIVRQDEPGYLWIRMPLDGKVYWLMATTSELPLGFSGVAIVIWGSALLLALLGAWYLQRLLNRPLSRLVQGSKSLTLSRGIEHLPEEGPTEILEVTRAFNQMSRSLSEQEEERTLMLAGVSHDLRTPLTKMRLAAEIMEDVADEEIIRSMRQSCRQMDSIIDQFMDLAGLGRDESWEVRELSEEVMAVLTLTDDSDIQASLTPSGNFRVMPRAFSRVLLNLIENARRYGKGPIEVSTGQSEQGLWIRIEDAGPGIAPEQQHEVLKPFVRGSSSRTGTPGAGLGLSIVQKIMQLHGGDTRLQNRPEGGLQVTLLFPPVL